MSLDQHIFDPFNDDDSPGITPTVDGAVIAEFVRQLYRDIDTGWLTLNHNSTPTGLDTDWFPIDQLDELAARAAAVTPRSGVWLPIATRTDRLTGSRRGNAADCLDVVALVADIDIAGPNHAATNLPATVADARALLDKFPVPPTVLVHTGGGLQGWWVLNEPVPAVEAEPVVRRFGITWPELGRRHGWKVDNVGTVEHIFRLPGTINGKTEPGVPVVVLEAHWDRRFSLDDIDQFTIEPATPERPPKAPSSSSTKLGDQRPGDIYNREHGCHDDLVAAGCVFSHSSRDGRRHYFAPAHAEARDQTGVTVYPDADGEHAVIWSASFAQQLGVYERASIDAYGLFVRVRHGGRFDEAGKALAAAQRDASPGPDTTEPSISADGDTSPEPPSGGRFFRKDIGLLHAALRDAVEDLGPLAAGPGRQVYRYERGVWLDDGDDEIRRRVSALLGNRHRRSHAEGIVEDIRARNQFITDSPETRWINTRNGLLDWMTGELLAHTPDVASTYQLAVDWNPTATCPTVDAWLDQVAPADAIELIWEVIGISIYADMPIHRAVLLVGPGRNGKGTLLRLIKALIGDRHISAVPLQSLAERFAPAQLFGKVANIAGDLDARSITRTDLFKMLTGGDMIAAEFKFGKGFTFTNRATMLFSANEMPGSADLSDGFFARWVVVPFNRMRLEAGQEDPTIEHRMHAELEGVLVQAVAGLRRVLIAGGFSRPESVAAASQAYRDHADPVRRFADEWLNISGNHDHRAARTTVYEQFKHWAEQNGVRAMPAARFYEHVESTFPQVSRVTVRGARYLAGMSMRSEIDA